MRLFTFGICSLAAAAMLSAPLLQSQQTLPSGTSKYILNSGTSKFILKLKGQTIGKADYTVQALPAGGYSITSHGSLQVGDTELSLEDKQALAASLEIDSIELSGNTGATKIGMSIKAEGDKLKLSISAAGALTPNTLDRRPHTVFLPNFDPSGMAVLVRFPGSGSPLWVLIPQQNGLLVAAHLEAHPDAKAILDGSPITAKHSVLTVGAVASDLYFAADGQFYGQVVASQAFSMLREGFALEGGLPAAAPTVYSGPPAGVAERTVNFPSGSLNVPGTLTMPTPGGKKPLPLVVFVGGSGTHDRDETIGPNKPIRDLTWELALRGIASLRYDKRTFFNPADFLKHPDLDQEVILDAVAALKFASAQEGIDPSRVFLAGHSLGGQMAPYIVEERLKQKPGSVRGMVLLAGLGTAVDTTLLRQVEMREHRAGQSEEKTAADLATVRAAFARIRDPRTAGTEPIQLIGTSLPASYWRDWLARNPAPLITRLGLPTLVLRGEKDLQVSEDDFKTLAAAATSPGSQTKEFAGLNHLFIAVSGEATGADYAQPGHVASEVVDTMVAWITKVGEARMAISAH